MTDTPPPDVYVGERQPGHRFELIAYGVHHGANVHAYYYKLHSALRAAALLLGGARWKIIDLQPELTDQELACQEPTPGDDTISISTPETVGSDGTGIPTRISSASSRVLCGESGDECR